jgi:hypothetical protein
METLSCSKEIIYKKKIKISLYPSQLIHEDTIKRV